MNSADENLLEVSGVTKRYGEATVLNDCRLNMRGGEIHTLLGGNGAGKSTLVRIIAGLVPPTAGKMRLNGQDYVPPNKRAAEAAGVEIVQQEFNLIPTLSAAENLLLSRLPARGGIIRQQELFRHAQAALKRLGLNDISPAAIVGTLGVGHQQMVEIAAALDRQCRLLILDEPTAALSTAETETLFEWLDRLRSQGVGIIYISHRLDEVARLSDRITVLRDGKSIGTHEAKNLTTDQMVDLMTGDVHVPPQTPTSEAAASDSSAVAMRVEGISGGMVQNVSFQVRRGERLGIAGLVGSGRTELLRLIFGADVPAAGLIFLGDDPRPHRFRHPQQAVAAGLAMVTEDRKKNGLLLPQSIRVNSTLAVLTQYFSRWGLLRTRAEEQSARNHCRSLETHCTSIEQPVGTLSGGNQQKVVVARWLATDASVFLFDEPTRGIDVPARRRIYRLLETLAGQGKGIVIVSSDLEELFETCDRIAVMSNGRLVETFARPEMSHERIMQAAFSGYLNRSGVA